MPKDRSSQFSFDNEDGVQDLSFQRTRPNRKVKKSSGGKVIFLFILILLLLGGLFAFAYMDIKKRVALLEMESERQNEALSEKVEERMAAIFSRYEDLEKSLTRKVFPMDEIFLALESSTSALDEKLDAVILRMDDVEDMQARLQYTKAEAEDLLLAENIIEGMHETLEPLKSEVDQVREAGNQLREEMKTVLQEEVESALDDFQSRISELSETIETASQISQEMGQLRSALETTQEDMKVLSELTSSLAAGSVSSTDLSRGLKNQEEALQRQIWRVSSQVKEKEEVIAGLQSRMDQVERMARAAERAAKASPPRAVQTPPKPGTFYEQDIQN